MRPTAAIRAANQRGMTLVECLVSTAIGGLIAAGLCHVLLTYQSGYQSQTTRIDHDQQARFALDLMVEELRVAERVVRGSGCAEPGVHIGEARVAFAANLYDRATVLREAVSAGQRRIVVANERCASSMWTPGSAHPDPRTTRSATCSSSAIRSRANRACWSWSMRVVWLWYPD